jgi:hypothetical protein
MDAETVVCDCHCLPMSYGVLSLAPEVDCVVCWMSDCGRYYCRSFGYFCIRPATWNVRKHIDNETQNIMKCSNPRCARETMALVRHPRLGGNTTEIGWRCFECGGEMSCLGATG